MILGSCYQRLVLVVSSIMAKIALPYRGSLGSVTSHMLELVILE